MPKEDEVGNTDRDTFTGWDPEWPYPDHKAREIVDAWGNPLVYLHWRDYKSPRSHMVKYRLKSGRTVRIKLARDATGAWPNWRKFAIWSLGPKGENRDGKDKKTPCNWRR